VTLGFQYTATCDQCGRDLVLHTKGKAEAVHALTDAGWQWVARGHGSELLCLECVARNSADAELRAEAGLPVVTGEHRLTRPKWRPAWELCKRCSKGRDYDHLVFAPFKPQKKCNLICEDCAFALLDSHGLKGYVDVPLLKVGEASRHAT
jgi:ribosomal protein S27E